MCETQEAKFGIRLAKLRGNRGVSARDMSLSLGQNAGYINNIENGKGFPSMRAFFDICQFLGVTPAEFFEEENGQPEQVREMIEDLKKLDQKQLFHIDAIVKGLVEKDLISVKNGAPK